MIGHVEPRSRCSVRFEIPCLELFFISFLKSFQSRSMQQNVKAAMQGTVLSSNVSWQCLCYRPWGKEKSKDTVVMRDLSTFGETQQRHLMQILHEQRSSRFSQVPAKLDSHTVLLLLLHGCYFMHQVLKEYNPVSSRNADQCAIRRSDLG